MTRRKGRIRDTDRGFERLMRQLRGQMIQRLAVGILANSGKRKHRDSDLSVFAIAMVHEYGSGSIPERSFIRAWADENHAKNLERIRRVTQAVYTRRGGEERMLRAMGREMVAEIRERMARGIDPPLAESTVERKGSSVPLVGGQLEKAIRSEVRSPRSSTRAS